MTDSPEPDWKNESGERFSHTADTLFQPIYPWLLRDLRDAACIEEVGSDGFILRNRLQPLFVDRTVGDARIVSSREGFVLAQLLVAAEGQETCVLCAV